MQRVGVYHVDPSTFVWKMGWVYVMWSTRLTFDRYKRKIINKTY